MKELSKQNKKVINAYDDSLNNFKYNKGTLYYMLNKIFY